MPAAAPDPPHPLCKHQQQPGWVHDVRIQTTTKLSTTGGTVWDAARRACAFLEALPPSAGLQRQGLQVLELGAGCGLLGLTLARNLPPGARVVLTEQAAGGALDHLAANVAANQDLPGCSRAAAAACDWRLAVAGGEEHPQQQQGAQPGQPPQQQAPEADPQEGHGGVPPQQCGVPGATPHSSQQHCSTSAMPAAVAADGAPQQPTSSHKKCEGPGRCSRWLAPHHVGPACWNYATGRPPGPPTPPSTALQESDAVSAAAIAAAQEQQPPAASAEAPSPGAPTTLQAGQQPSSSGISSSSSSGGDVAGGGPSSCGGLPAGCWDLVVGSDLVYNSAGTHMLPRLLARLVGPTTLAFYAHTKHRFDALDLELQEQLAAAGLALAEVWEPGAVAPPSSPPPLTTLFPDMRVAVYHIFPAPASEGQGA